MEEPRGRGDAYALFVARRFLRARRQGFLSLISILSASSFLLGVASLILALALMTGFQGDVIHRILGSNAHGLVFAADGAPIERARELAERVRAVPGVVAAEPVVQGYAGIAAQGGLVQWSSVQGILPEYGGTVTGLDERMVEGSLDDLVRPTASGRPAIVLGSDLARKLGVLRGDIVRLIVPKLRLTPWGVSIRRPAAEVVGTFATGFYEYDTSWSFVSLEEGRRLFDAEPEGCHWIAFRVADLDRLAEVEQAIEDAVGPGYLVSDILEQNKPYFSALRLEKLLISLSIGLIVLVAAFGVIITLILTVTQKVREIGVLSALGATPRGILKIFVYQGLAMGLLGTAAGAALGCGLAWYLDRYRVIGLDPEVYLLDHLPFVVQAADLAWVVGIAVVVALLATIYPAWRAARLDPVEALRRD